jgi:hypothetical protein
VHARQPLPAVALGDTAPDCQFAAGRRTVLREVLPEAELVTDRGELHRHQGTDVAQHLADELVDGGLLGRDLGGGHVVLLGA